MGLVTPTFDARGLASLVLLGTSSVLKVQNDNFAIGLNGTTISSASLPPPQRSDGDGATSFVYTATGDVKIQVTYTVPPSAAFVTKAITVTSTSTTYNITNVTLFAGVSLTLDGAPPASSAIASSHFGLKDYVLFQRWPAKTMGALLTAQNPFLDISAGYLSYAPAIVAPAGQSFAADAAHLGLHVLSNQTMLPPAAPLDTAEHAAMASCVAAAMSAPARATSVLSLIHI